MVESNHLAGKFSENIILLNDALKKKGDEPELLKLLIHNYLEAGKKNSADSLFRTKAELFLDADYIDFYIDRCFANSQYAQVLSAMRIRKLQKRTSVFGWDKFFLSLINSGKIDSLEFFANEYISNNDNYYLGYYYKGLAYEHRSAYGNAKTEFNKALYYIDQIPEAKSKASSCIHAGLARVYFHYKQYDNVVLNCNDALGAVPSLPECHYLKGKALVEMSNYAQAQEAFQNALNLAPDNPLFLKSLFYNSVKINNYDQALVCIRNLGNLVSLNDTLVFDRAKVFLRNKLYLNAYNDFRFLQQKEAGFMGLESLLQESRVDRKPPSIQIISPIIDTIKYGLNVKKITFEVEVKDASGLTTFSFNDSTRNLSMDETYRFKQTLIINAYPSITFSSTDAFGNTAQESIPIKVDFEKPTIDVVFPQLLNGKSLVPENPDDAYLYLEMIITDNNRIENLRVNGMDKMVTQKRQTKSYEKVLIEKRDSILVEVEDEMGNWARESYFIDRAKSIENQRNPMGKTFALIITNSTYQNLKELSGPIADARMLKSCLSNYLIDSVVHLENLSLADFRKVINTDVATWINKYHINSLVIWYGGHGSYSEFHNSGYWIPIEAGSNDFDNYYSLTELKIVLSSYKKLNHLLLISDACQTGQSFYSKSILKSSGNPCEDWKLTKMRSAECFTSSDNQLSSDNSIFARTFTRVLQNNPSDCIGIVDVAGKVTEIVTQNQAQSPIFGNITGMESENGSFIFIKRSFLRNK